MTTQSEKEKYIEMEICTYLHLIGASVDKINSEGYYDPKQGRYRSRNNWFSNPGISDIIGCYQGRYFCIEVKRPEYIKDCDRPIHILEDEFRSADSRNLDPLTMKKYLHKIRQREFIDGKILAGGIGFFASSLEDVAVGFAKFGITLPLP